ncbi:MAG: hypothetical protein ACO32H_01005 [Steroidobacteraceae bacterium]
MSDFALGIVVFIFVAVPASLLLLALADVIRLEGEGRRKRWIRNCLWALAVPASVPIGMAAWGWAGAAHLQPLCQAYASPEFRSDRAVAATRLVVVGSDFLEDAPPAWLRSIEEQLRMPPGPLETVVIERSSKNDSRGRTSSPGQTLRLEVNRLVHHENIWFRVEMDRFRLADDFDGMTLALADEIWIDAGRSRYRCGIMSGPYPKNASNYPSGDGITQWVRRVLTGAPTKTRS